MKLREEFNKELSEKYEGAELLMESGNIKYIRWLENKIFDENIEFLLNDILNKALLTNPIKGSKCSNTIAQYVIDYLKDQ